MKRLKRLIPNKIKYLYKSYIKEQYKKRIIGDNVYCPICKSSFSFFAPGGMDKRLNARCHRCNSLERHRLLYLYLEKNLNFFNNINNIKILHFAPEKFYYEIFCKMENVEYMPCDLFPDLYNYNGLKKISKVDMTSIQFAENSFDFILHNQVLEHIPNDKLAIKELYRVMKENGSGIFQVPIDYSRAETYEDFSITSPEERKKAFGQYDHVRWYGRDYKERLESVGFKVKEDAFVKQFTEIELKRYGLTSTEFIYFCEK